MVKNTIVALIAAVSLSSVAVPAFAAPAPAESEVDTVFGGGTPELRALAADTIVTQLQRKGVNATAVEDWSGLIRAYVTLDDGTQTMQFFKPGSLEQVQL